MLEKRIITLFLILALYFSFSTLFIFRNQNKESPVFFENALTFKEKKEITTKEFSNFSINTRKDLEAFCRAKSPSYTDLDYKYYFNFKKISNCTTRKNDIFFYENEKVFAKCFENEPLFSVDPGQEQILGGGVKDNVTWTKEPIIGRKSEYAFIRCGSFTYSLFFLRFNKTAAEQANLIRFSKRSDPRPMNVFLLVLDSLSRFTSYKYLPNTTAYLRGLMRNEISQFNDYSAYEFIHNAIPEAFTLPNMCRILYGIDYHIINKEFKVGSSKFKEGINEDALKCQRKNSIWHYFQKQGFVTSFMMETVHDFLNYFTGHYIESDHVFQNYWRSAWDVYGFNEFDNRQRCHGSQNTHNLTFGYMLDFFEKYENNSKFVYLHLNSAHDYYFGNIQSVDNELLHFLQTLLKTSSLKGENLAFLLISDHGLRIRKLLFDEREFAENNSPLFYLILNKEIEESLDARENLRHNSNMLIGRYDINYLLKFLAHFSYEKSGNFSVEGLSKNYIKSVAVNLLTEKISPNRTCRDLDVPKFSCPCNSFKKIHKNNKKEMNAVQKFYPLLESYFDLNVKEHNCPSGISYVFRGGEKFQMGTKVLAQSTIYRLNFTVNSNSEISAEFNFCYINNESEELVARIKRVKKAMYLEYKEGEDRVFIFLKKVVVNENKCKIPKCFCKE